MKKVLAALVLGAALVTSVVGCGGGSSTTVTKSTKS
jgi:hypothetical protein